MRLSEILKEIEQPVIGKVKIGSGDPWKESGASDGVHRGHSPEWFINHWTQWSKFDSPWWKQLRFDDAQRKEIFDRWGPMYQALLVDLDDLLSKGADLVAAVRQVDKKLTTGQYNKFAGKF